MRQRVALVLSLALLLFITSCTSVGAPEPVHTIPAGSDSVVNVGDEWYLPINKDGLPEKNIEVIFSTIQAWKSEHPNLRIVDQDILYMQNTHSLSTSNYTYGVVLLTESKP